MTEVKPNEILIQMTTLPVVADHWTKVMLEKYKAEHTPHFVPVGGFGRVIAVGTQRETALLHKRVLVVEKTREFSDVVINTDAARVFELPENMTDEAAATLIQATSALQLVNLVQRSTAPNVFITGENSVIGLYVLQLLQNSGKTLFPIVSDISQSYFAEKWPMFTRYTADDLPDELTDDMVMIDAVGSLALLDHFARHYPVVQTASVIVREHEKSPVFSHIPTAFDRTATEILLKKLASDEVIAPIGAQFKFDELDAAQAYIKDTRGRGGRVTVTL
ncbi:MAG TPA: hypothetical protein VGM95_01775 [Lactobacillaceae bacterium]|jgi:hypothetical protein